MSLSPLEQTVFAYYAATAARDLNVATRWYPYGELILIMEDKVAVATRKFGLRVKASARAAGTGFLDYMITRGGWETKQNDFGGTMHQFQAEAFRKALHELTSQDPAIAPIIAEADATGEDFWATRFSALTAA